MRLSSLQPTAYSLQRTPGFTLIEVMVAVAVIGISFVALLGLHNRNIQIVGRDQDMTYATLLARQLVAQMEVIEKFPDLGTSNGNFDAYPGFRWEREVTEVQTPDGEPMADVRKVDFRVVFDERIPDACRMTYYIRDRRDPDEQ